MALCISIVVDRSITIYNKLLLLKIHIVLLDVAVVDVVALNKYVLLRG